jgi:hypothetical protein
MRSKHRSPLALALAAGAWLGLALAIAASADTKRWFEGSDKVYVRLRQHDIFERIQEPDVHMERALRRFEKGMKSSAADELEKAAAGFSYFADRSAGAERRELELAGRALNRLADDVRRRKVSEVTTLERAVADAERVLAGEPPKPAQQGPPPPSE